MESLRTLVQPAARVLAGLLFLVAGLGKVGSAAGVAGYMESVGLPGALVWPAILFEILAGLALIVGFQTRAAGLLLAGFCVLTAVVFHFDPADQMQFTSFLKNLALAGGYLMFFLYGAGAFSLDARAGRYAPGVVAG